MEKQKIEQKNSSKNDAKNIMKEFSLFFNKYFTLYCNSCSALITSNSWLCGFFRLQGGKIALIFDPLTYEEEYKEFSNEVKIESQLNDYDHKKLLGLNGVYFNYILCNCGKIIGMKIEYSNKKNALIVDKVLIRFDLLKLIVHYYDGARFLSRDYKFRTSETNLKKMDKKNTEIVKWYEEFSTEINDCLNAIKAQESRKNLLDNLDYYFERLNYYLHRLKNFDLI